MERIKIYLILGSMLFFTTHILYADNVSVEFIEKGEKFTPWDDMIAKEAAHRRQGDTYLQQGKYDEAIEEYKKSLEIDPNLNRLSYIGIFEAQEQKADLAGDYRDAIEALEELIEHTAEHAHPPLIKRLRSLEFAQQGIYKRAAYYAKKAYEIRKEEMHKYYLGVMGASYNKGKRKEFILRRSKERAEESSESYRLRWKKYEELANQQK